MFGFQLDAVAAKAGSCISRLCRLLVGVSATISRTYDTLGRPAGLAVAGVGDPGPPPYQVAYGYDDFGRLASVSASVGAVAFSTAYSSLPASGLLEATSFSIQNSTFSIQRSYEPHRDLIAAVTNAFDGAPVSHLRLRQRRP